MRPIALLFLAAPLLSQGLLQEIEKIAAEAQGKVAVACSLPGAKLKCGLNEKSQPPMQSVFKLPLAMAVLHAVEQGQFRVDQPIRFTKPDRFFPKTHSPLQDKYPEADVDVSLEELMRLSVSASDNVAADVLLRVLGGPQKVQAYIDSLGIQGFQIRDGERELHRDNQLQYRNWWTPVSAVQLLRRVAEKSPFNAANTALLHKWMRETETGPKRLKGELPAGTPVFHKTGTSGVTNGLAAATNDIGFVRLADGRHLAIAVFVGNSRAPMETREAVIARIAKAIYDASSH